MRNGIVLTRVILILGILLAMNASAWSQELPAPDSAPPREPTMTVAGRVRGQTPLPSAEALAVVLLPGWSETLGADIAAGTGLMVLLQSGRVERLVVAQSDTGSPARQPGFFEFRNISPGEYQAVVVRIKEGADVGAAIATGNRVVVGDRDITDLELEITSLPPAQTRKRHGSAADREAAVLETVNRPMDAMPPTTRPTGPTASPSSSGVSTKKDILEQILVGIGLFAVMATFSLW